MRPGYVELTVNKADVKTTIYTHSEFTAFVDDMNRHYGAWQESVSAILRGLEPGFIPKELIGDISESLLEHYRGKPLIDCYDIYQHLMDYWAETMQDDAYIISADGWKAETYRVMEKAKNGKEKDKGWACDLVPKPLIVARYFGKEQNALDSIQTEIDRHTAALAELEEEHGGEEGLFAELEKINKSNVTARVKAIKKDKDAGEELDALNKWIQTNNVLAAAKKKYKEADAKLDALAYAKYTELTETDVKELVVNDKWLTTIKNAVHSEMDRISQRLTGRIGELADRYGTPLPQINKRASELEEKVNAHLKKMGFTV
jgi:type I restriction enzyme M protein